MSRAVWLATTWLCLATAAGAEPPAEAIVGRYLAQDKDHKIEIFLRAGTLHGRIAWTKDPNLTDEKNKDPNLRSRQIAGIEHIRGFTRSRDGSWTGGTLYNPEDGGIYEAKLWLEDSRLVIQGRPKIPVIGGILGALFGRITYTREAQQ